MIKATDLRLIIQDTANPYKKTFCESLLKQLEERGRLSSAQEQVAKAWIRHYENKITVKLRLPI